MGRLMSARIRIGLLGCGVVGAGFLRLLASRSRAVESAAGAPLRVTRLAVRDPGRRREVDLSGVEIGTDPLAVASADDVDLLVELMGGAETARPAVERALERGIPVVTANKHLISVHGAALEAAAAASGAPLLYEASVAGVIPVLQALDHGLRTERFTLLVGILNGTTNYILSTMEREGRSFEEALAAARELGYAEADPTLDLSGADTAQKLTVLARRAFGAPVPHDSIPTEGIVGLELEDLRQADRFGYVVKLLGIGIRSAEGLDLRVHPAFIPKRYLLASVRDEFNGVYLRGDASGSMLLYGKGAGALPTAQAVLGDVIAVARELLLRGGAPARRPHAARAPAQGPEDERLPLDEVRTKYYLRLMVEDQPGVLAQIAHRLGASRVSVAQMHQAQSVRGQASITMLTHETRDKDAREAVAAIASIPSVLKGPRA
ncbi:MAG TPA: homoserine dehydrogenase, partial [Candidatus Eisenbacteria bacterium]|nr:homoserine dehydrogenase [Candidatus Eisenbacteria bacterium]